MKLQGTSAAFFNFSLTMNCKVVGMFTGAANCHGQLDICPLSIKAMLIPLMRRKLEVVVPPVRKSDLLGLLYLLPSNFHDRTVDSHYYGS